MDFVFQWKGWPWKKFKKWGKNTGDNRDVNSFPKGTHMKVELRMDWEMRVRMEAKLELSQSGLSQKLFKKGFTFRFAIGPVPVIVEPYVKLTAGLKLPTVEVCFILYPITAFYNIFSFHFPHSTFLENSGILHITSFKLDFFFNFQFLLLSAPTICGCNPQSIW